MSNQRLYKTPTRGFTLMEVLIALGLFAIGFVAVAAIFPAGVALQKKAADASLARQHVDSAVALIEALSLTYDAATATGDLNFYHTSTASTDDYVKQFPNPDAAGTLMGKWSVSLRSHPTTIPNATEKSYFWIPLIQDRLGNATSPSWSLFVFAVRREHGATYDTTNGYPSGQNAAIPVLLKLDANRIDAQTFNITSTMPTVIPGDQFLSQDGTIHTVRSVSGTEIGVFGAIPASWSSGDDIWVAERATSNTQRPVAALLEIPFTPSAP